LFYVKTLVYLSSEENAYKITPMLESPYKKVIYSMLSGAGEPMVETTDFSFAELGWVAYPLPPDMGQGGYEALELALGMTLVRTTFEFSPAMAGQWLPFMETDVEYKEPSFQALTFRGARGSVKELYPPANLAFSAGMDLFRHTTHYCSSFSADGSYSGEACHLSLSRTMLNQTIGVTLADQLLAQLSITAMPSVAVRAVPLHVSQLLLNASSPLFTGQTRKLYCQAKVLEYLAALVQHVCGNVGSAPEPNQQGKQRARDIHDRLLACEGKFPTLDDLAKLYGRSAKLLNDEFCVEFGQSIYSFFTDYRLSQAHAVLQNSKISIKQLAAKLGYRHVSNFTIAFKRKFGYSPGSVRRASPC
jgi:AraC-like DNA-binding protein